MQIIIRALLIGALDKCGICKREMCAKDGGSAHAGYSLDVYRYGDGKRSRGQSKICKDCIKKKPPSTIQELIDGILGEAPVIVE